MNEELDYAEMLEIPVETVTVNKKERKNRGHEGDLSEQLVEQVNDRMEEADDPAFAESKTIAREEQPEKKRKLTGTRKILLGEFVAVCALCAVIFLTNIFMTNSAINTFVRGLFQGSAQAYAADNRSYSDFQLSSPVSDYADVDITVSDTGVLSFTSKCSVYAPCDGKVSAVNGNKESGYTVEIRHSDSFTSIISGLDDVYLAAGDVVKSNLPLGFSGGESAVRVTFYSDGALVNCTYGENGLAWA